MVMAITNHSYVLENLRGYLGGFVFVLGDWNNTLFRLELFTTLEYIKHVCEIQKYDFFLGFFFFLVGINLHSCFTEPFVFWVFCFV